MSHQHPCKIEAMELLAKASPFQTRELIVLFIMYGGLS